MRSDYDEGPSLWKIVGVFIGVLAVIGVISLGIWGLRVAFAPVKGQGDTIIKNEGVDNRTRAQEKFYTMYNGIVALDANIAVLAATAREHPNDRIARQNVDGQIIACQQAVEAYNAETRKILSRDWRDPELPYEINPNDPKTDCRENVK